MVIGLKTAKGTKQLKLDPSIHDALQARVLACRACLKRLRALRAACCRELLAAKSRAPGAAGRPCRPPSCAPPLSSPGLSPLPQKEKVAPGDVIYIEANSGSVKRVGRRVQLWLALACGGESRHGTACAPALPAATDL